MRDEGLENKEHTQAAEAGGAEGGAGVRSQSPQPAGERLSVVPLGSTRELWAVCRTNEVTRATPIISSSPSQQGKAGLCPPSHIPAVHLPVHRHRGSSWDLFIWSRAHTYQGSINLLVQMQRQEFKLNLEAQLP